MLLLRALLLTLFLGLSPLTLAISTEQTVFDLRTGVQLSLLHYYHYQADEENPQLLTQLRASIEQNNDRRLRLQASLPAQFINQSQSLESDWQRFTGLLEQNIREIEESHFPELQLVTQMRESVQRMMATLDDTAEQLRAGNEALLSSEEVWSRQQKKRLLTIAERYLERAASSMGAPLTVGGESVEDLCRQFSGELTRAAAQSLPEQTSATLNKIRSQWLFVEKAANDTESQLVPFLMMRYTQNILSQLDRLATAG